MREKIHNIVITLITIISLFLLVALPDICLEGAKNGLLLWFHTIVPTLFPFFLLTKIIVLFNMWPNTLIRYYPYFIGLISGYPNGAIAVSQYCKKNLLTKKQAQTALIICNNASPVFLISYVGLSALSGYYGKYTVWLLVIMASFITFLLLAFFYRDKKNKPATNMAGLNDKTKFTHKIFEQMILDSFEILVMICGYMIIFGVYARLITYLPIPRIISALLAGMLEITTGINQISVLEIPIEIKYQLSAFISCFGGLSALFQCKGFINDAHLSVTKYLFHKLACAILCMAMIKIYITIM